MNAMPNDWSEQLQAAYPQRSGPSGWKGVRLMLALRRALLDSTWEQIISGCENYRTYCRAAGIEGTGFVQAPQRFIDEGSFTEEFIYQAPEDPKIIEARAKEAERWSRAREVAKRLNPVLTAYPLESVGAFETRIALAQTRGPSRAGELQSRVSELASRMRIAK